MRASRAQNEMFFEGLPVTTITLTPRAVSHVRNLMNQNSLEGYGLRVAVSPGGCSGFSYILDLVEGEEDDDRIFEHEGIRIFCDPKSLLYIEGIEIDYESNMMSGGFKFSNPNAKKSCGCGTSFSC